MSKRIFYSLFIPPLAACRYGCAGCCAAPIGLFWFSGIVSIIYGVLGGPAQSATISWPTSILGIVLWVLASIWAITVVIRDKSRPACSKKPSKVCRIVGSNELETDPMDEVNKFQN